MTRIKKVRPSPQNTQIVKTEVKERLLRFSFRFFCGEDEEVCPRAFQEGYVHTLMERLRDLSSWTVGQFTNQYHKTIRNHKIEWRSTARPNGFTNLNEQFAAYEAWQFCLTSNEHGRVHGLIIDDVFYVIWLDANHAVYPSK